MMILEIIGVWKMENVLIFFLLFMRKSKSIVVWRRIKLCKYKKGVWMWKVNVWLWNFCLFRSNCNDKFRSSMILKCFERYWFKSYYCRGGCRSVRGICYFNFEFVLWVFDFDWWL